MLRIKKNKRKKKLPYYLYFTLNIQKTLIARKTTINVRPESKNKQPGTLPSRCQLHLRLFIVCVGSVCVCRCVCTVIHKLQSCIFSVSLELHKRSGTSFRLTFLLSQCKIKKISAHQLNTFRTSPIDFTYKIFSVKTSK